MDVSVNKYNLVTIYRLTIPQKESSNTMTNDFVIK